MKLETKTPIELAEDAGCPAVLVALAGERLMALTQGEVLYEIGIDELQELSRTELKPGMEKSHYELGEPSDQATNHSAHVYRDRVEIHQLHPLGVLRLTRAQLQDCVDYHANRYLAQKTQTVPMDFE